MKKILIVDESKLFREYLSKKLEAQGFEVVQGFNGLDGSVKLRNEIPDLIILDYYLSRKSCAEFLKEKKENPNVVNTPVIMVSSKISKMQLLEISRFGVKKFFSKPLKIDSFLATISDLMNVSVVMDNTPCIIEAHFNDDILFIEIARGLNTEKIELLGYKITELLDLYEVGSPKILIMLSNIDVGAADEGKLEDLFNVVLDKTGTPNSMVKILTSQGYVKEFINRKSDFRGMKITDNLENAMDDLIGMKADKIAHDKAAEKLLTRTAPRSDKQESFELRFHQESLAGGREISVAVVDDDFVIQELVKAVLGEAGWKVKSYDNGKIFVDAVEKDNPDLIFLDLMMPEMNGFEVLQHLKERDVDVPVIIFSALTKKETVARAISFGINSYIIKPIKPDKLLRKASEVLRANF